MAGSRLAHSGVHQGRSQLRAQGSLGEGCDMSASHTPSLSTPWPLGTRSVLFPAAFPFHTQLRKKAHALPTLPLLPPSQIFWPEPWETYP